MGVILGLTPSEVPDILGALVAGWSSPVARRAHNPKVAGSNPAPAMILRSSASGGGSHVGRPRERARNGLEENVNRCRTYPNRGPVRAVGREEDAGRTA